ncbi:hypothetical protein LINPERHAP1_LOCUS21854 [Linum perenne]
MKIGINAPMELEIRDDRLINDEESIIAKGEGNLGVGILKFDINLQQGLSLTDGNLDSAIVIKYELKRNNFMKENCKPFSVTYQINYALTNSHHSLTFKDKEAITIEDLFKPVIHLESPLKIIKSNHVQPRISIDNRSSLKQIKNEEEEEKIKNITILHQNDNTEEIKKVTSINHRSRKEIIDMPPNHFIHKLLEGLDSINLTSINDISSTILELSYFASDIVEEQMCVGTSETLDEAVAKNDVITDLIKSLNKIKQRLIDNQNSNP